MTGGRTVKDLLTELAIDPDTVLVIKDRTLLTRDERVEDDTWIEIRPVISGGAGGRRPHTKCRRCRQPAVIELRRHNAAFCQPCFIKHFQDQVKRAIKDFDMLEPEDRVLVAVSGGKDSLALWDVLLDLGYRSTGMYLGLGIGDYGDYSDRSGEAARRFAEDRGADLLHIDLRDEYGFDIPSAGTKGSRSTCSVCGLSKRYTFNRVALDRGFDVVATGHNLDDEPPRCSAIRSAGRPNTWLASSPRSARGRAWSRRSNPCTGCRSGRPPPTHSSKGSTMWSRSARWWKETPSSNTRTR